MKRHGNHGAKRRFITFGICNLACSNGLLQILLACNLATGLATLLSQVFNASLGYVLYGTQVFRVTRLDKYSASTYSTLAILLWIANWSGINSLRILGWSRQTAALALIPILGAVSYIIQKQLVFRVSRNTSA